MRDHEQRVIEEAEELRLKIEKLSNFIDGESDIYRQIPLMEKERLHLQRYLMAKYHDVLLDRINYFTE